VVTTAVTVAASGYAQPARTLTRGQVVELSAAEVTAVGSSNLRTISTSMHDVLGESAGCSNGD
jgi:hypothetical protein